MLTPIVLIYAFIASVVADYATDLRINQTYVSFMNQFEAYLTKTSDQVAWEIYSRKVSASNSTVKAPSVEEIRQISKEIVDPLIAQYKPIAYKIIHDAGYNTKRDYYVYDNSTRKWHLPGQAAPSTPVDGATLNAQHLSRELERAFKQLISSDKATSMIQKRRWFGGISSETRNVLRNLDALPLDDAIQRATEYLPNAAKDQENYVQDYLKGLQHRRDLREEATFDGRRLLDNMDKNPSWTQRLDELQKELLNAPI